MVKILFVCHGNICRSPMAEFVFRDLAERQGVGDRFRCDSAATSREEIGNPVHRGTRRKLAEHGIDCGGKTAVQLVRADYGRYDWLLGMDAWNLSNMVRLFDGDPENKVRRLLDFTDQPRDIADPWYTGNFDVTWKDVVKGCQALLDFLRGQEGGPDRQNGT